MSKFIGNTYDNWEVMSADIERNNKEIERVKSGEVKTRHKYWMCKCAMCGNLQSVGSSSFSPRRKNQDVCVKCNSIGTYLINTFGNSGIEKYWGKSNSKDPFKIRKSTRDKCWFKCEKHDEYYVDCANFYFGQRCPVCSSSEIRSFVNDAYTLMPKEAIKFVKNKECLIGVAKNSRNKIAVRCLNCNEEKLVSISYLTNHLFSCDKCSDGFSYPNKFMFNLLKQLDIEFQTEYSPEWISPKRYDFYIPSKDLIIEMDGGFHYRDNNMNGKTAEDSVVNDNYKDDMAIKNGLDIIRINCFYGDIVDRSYLIKSNTIESLTHIFELNNIDWDIIDLMSTDSKIKQAWDLWNIHKNNDRYFTTTNLSKLMGINRTSVKMYIAKGRDLGMCIYDEYEERAITCEKMYTKTSKRVECFRDGDSVGVFNSCCELERKSPSICGTKLLNSKISQCARSGKQYKGFTFLYI